MSYALTFVCVLTAYHCKCIDTWLVQDSDLCPLCKKSVIDDDDDESDAESAAAAAGGGGASSSAHHTVTAAASNIQDDDETEDAPLLRAPSRRTPQSYASRFRGTFTCAYIVASLFLCVFIS